MSATWSTHPNRATNAPYRILDGSTEVFSTTVNQEVTPLADAVDLGTNFQHLGGLVTISSGTLVVELSDDANEYVIADAVRIEAVAALNVSIAADSIPENGGSTTATVSRIGDTTNPLLVNLSSNDTSEATVPLTVTIPAGQSTSLPFDIDAIDDAIVDGTQFVTITAGAPGYSDGSDSVDVTDNDVPELTLDIVATSISEGDGPAATTATVSRNTDTTNPLTVTLTSSDISEAAVPSTVIIPAGQFTSLSFDIDAIDDLIVDGTQTVTVTAAAAAHADGSDTFDVLDDDTPSTTQIIDNGDPGFSTIGAWAGPYAGQGYLNDVEFSGAGSGAKVASWTFTSLAVGQYQVSVTWSTNSNRATDAPYRILDGAVEVFSTTVNQEVTPLADAVDLGTNFQHLGGLVTISSGTLVVELTDNANEYVIADAVRIEPVVAPGRALSMSIVAAPISANGGSTAATVSRTGETTKPLLADLSANSKIFVSAGHELVSSGVRLDAGETAQEDDERDSLFGSYDRDWFLTDDDTL